MSLNKDRKLVLVAQKLCRELRKDSTPSERTFWEMVRGRRFFGKKFYRQYPIFFDYYGKETFFIADFYCHENRVMIELDGKIHDYRKDHDQLRTHIMNFLGITVVRFRNDEVDQKLDTVTKRLKVYLGA